MLKKCCEKHHDCFYVVVRVLTGLMFAMHGTGKLWGFLGKGPMTDNTLMLVAGVVELLVGLALVLGILSRLAALGGAVTMLVAYFMMHFPQGWNPLMNGGELALTYLLLFLVVMGHGNGKKCTLEKKLFGKELC